MTTNLWLCVNQKVTKSQRSTSFLSPKDIPALKGTALSCAITAENDATGSGTAEFQVVIADNYHFHKYQVIGRSGPVSVATLKAGAVVTVQVPGGTMLSPRAKPTSALASALKVQSALPPGRHYVAAWFELRGEVAGVFSARLIPA